MRPTDHYGLGFLQRAGFLRKLQKVTHESNATSFLSSHPATEERIKLVEGRLKQTQPH